MRIGCRDRKFFKIIFWHRRSEIAIATSQISCKKRNVVGIDQYEFQFWITSIAGDVPLPKDQKTATQWLIRYLARLRSDPEYKSWL